MIVGILKLSIYIPWSQSLKDKRMVTKSLCAKVRNKFNVSIGEVDCQDIHQTIVIGISYVTTDSSYANSIGDNVLNFIENNSEGEIIKVDRLLF